MTDIKPIIAKNIVDLRIAGNMTQSELAQKLNYSDKAVSKWERAESIPDVAVLMEIAQVFGVSLDYLTKEEHSCETEKINSAEEEVAEEAEKRCRNRKIVAGLSVALVWFVATLVFVVADILWSAKFAWLAFMWALPVTAIVWIVFNSMWFNKKRNYFIVSLLMWSVLAAVYLSVLMAGASIWQLFILGVPGQVIICIWSKFNVGSKKQRKDKKETEQR